MVGKILFFLLMRSTKRKTDFGKTFLKKKRGLTRLEYPLG